MHNHARRTVSRRHLTGAALALATAVIAPRTSAASPMSATPAPNATDEALAAAVQTTMEAGGIPGAVVLVERPDPPIWTRGFGFADIQAKLPMTGGHHLRIGSITKTLTATLVLQLVDEGAISLSDTLADSLPTAGLAHADRITIRQLLDMRSGVFDYLEDETFFPQVIADPTRTWTPDELIEIASGQAPYDAPGVAFRYSNTNYILLGMIVERLTDRPVADVLTRRILEPLGMAETSLPADESLPAPAARGYAADPDATDRSRSATPDAAAGFEDVTDLSPSIAWTAGGMVSTVGDLQIWVRSLVEGTLISADLQRDRLTMGGVAPGVASSEIGYGLGVANFGGLIGHDGSIPGYQSFAGYDPTIRESIIVLINAEPTPDVSVGAATIVEAIRGIE